MNTLRGQLHAEPKRARTVKYPDSVSQVFKDEAVRFEYRNLLRTEPDGCTVSDHSSELPETVKREAVSYGIAARRGLELSAVLASDQSTMVLHKPIRARLAEAAYGHDVAFRTLPSDATHNAAHVARVAYTRMLFVPSQNGLSHAPGEWSNVEDISLGAEVMAEALCTIDEEVS